MFAIFVKCEKYNHLKKILYYRFLKNYRSYNKLNNLKIREKRETKNLIFLKAFRI